MRGIVSTIRACFNRRQAIAALRGMVLVVPAAGLAACSNIPQYDTPSQFTVAHIIDQIQCEVAQAARYFPNPKLWWAAIDLTLQVDDSVDLNPKVSFIQPLKLAGQSFTFDAGAQLKRERQRIYAETLELQVSRAHAKACDILKDSFDLTGNLGIVETVRTGVGSYDGSDGVSFQISDDKKSAFGQTIQFVVTKNVSGVGPTWTFTHFTGPGGLFGAERVDTHKLIISFAQVPAKVAVDQKGRPKPSALISGAATGPASLLNQKMLFQSLPTFRPSR
jgi:hypothetical protein